jgi:murein L,D-transpeptidase YcbB/YkuD
MRNRLLLSAAILAAGVALASAQHAPGGGTGQDRPQARKHDANHPSAAQNRRSQDSAARKAAQPQHAAAKHAGESHGETSQHNARSLPPRATREHGDLHGGLASDSSIRDRAIAQGRAQLEQSIRQHQGRSQTTAATPGYRRGAKDHAKDHGKDHAKDHQEAHRPPNHVMGRASEKELKAHSAAPSHPHQDKTSSSHAGEQADVRQAQTALNQQGFSVGDPDGKLGQRTKKALIAFQKQHGFQTTGRVDRATLEALNGAGRNRAQQTPAQAAPQNVPAVPATTGQGSATPAAAQQQPTEEETPPAAAHDGQHLPDASSRVPAGSPQEDYKDDLVPSGNDQR